MFGHRVFEIYWVIGAWFLVIIPNDIKKGMTYKSYPLFYFAKKLFLFMIGL